MSTFTVHFTIRWVGGGYKPTGNELTSRLDFSLDEIPLLLAKVRGKWVIAERAQTPALQRAAL